MSSWAVPTPTEPSPASGIRRQLTGTTIKTISQHIKDGVTATMFALLDKEHSIAGPGFNRWMVPPAALAIHLCIGMAYGFSVFWLPLTRAIGITSSVACPKEMDFLSEIMSTGCDWKVTSLVVMFQLFFIFLGGAATVLQTLPGMFPSMQM